MINYKRTNWYGLAYLLRLRGSLLPHCIPAMIVAGALAGIFTLPAVTSSLGVSSAELFVDKYSMQLFGVVFGYIAVARLNVSYNRYWEGISQIKMMHSKFIDACSQSIAFDRIDQIDEDASRDEFCRHVVRQFIQLSAVATLSLHLESDEIDDLWLGLESTITSGHTVRESAETIQIQMALVERRHLRRFQDRPLAEDWLRRLLGRFDNWLHRKDVMKSDRASRRQSTFAQPVSQNMSGAHLSMIEYTANALDLKHLFTYREVVHLRGLPDPVVAQAHRIYRTVTTRGRTRGWSTPPPIVSRIFQELSNGLLAFNHATKMKEVPVPFAYVQFNALLLNTFNVLCPIAIARFTEHTVMSVITAALITGGFTALWLVANELEDPFGTDQNDLPVLQYHESFCGSCRSLLKMLDEDMWVAAKGPWVPARPINRPTGHRGLEHRLGQEGRDRGAGRPDESPAWMPGSENTEAGMRLDLNEEGQLNAKAVKGTPPSQRRGRDGSQSASSSDTHVHKEDKDRASSAPTGTGGKRPNPPSLGNLGGLLNA
mmetsp:Transcript_3079/g.6601  ORF Transcript_3079/g.6601 Transcript_3079/m.6601 type:complete len:543 (-) Transcript_3079:654-2282(-)